MRTKKMIISLSFVVTATAAVVASPPASAAGGYYKSINFGGALPSYSFAPGGFSIEQGGTYRAIFQSDGNFVVYFINATPARALWSSGTANKGAARLVLQSDCNMVIYGRNNAVLWTSRTNGRCGQYYGILTMQDDGNLVEYVPNSSLHPVAVWASNSVFH